MQLGNSLTCGDYNSYILMIVFFFFTQNKHFKHCFLGMLEEWLKVSIFKIFFLVGEFLNCPLIVYMRRVLNPEMTFSLHPIERNSKTAELVPTCLPLHPPTIFSTCKISKKKCLQPSQNQVTNEPLKSQSSSAIRAT